VSVATGSNRPPDAHRLYSELGLATHYIPSRRVPELIARLAGMEDASYEAINSTIEEHSAEITSEDTFNNLVGPVREAIDRAFVHNRVDKIINELRTLVSSENETVRSWAQKTVDTLESRSPTSLKVALHAIRKGSSLSLAEALQMELGVATAYCVSPLVISPGFVRADLYPP
jgi:3-hydroxyisobutyryl-CoA hydrolase